jgi:Inner membrane component of T3SS, cytoplasmic domain
MSAATPVVPPLYMPAGALSGQGRQRPLLPPVSVVTPVGEFELLQGSLLIGRLADCTICLSDNLVSRMHARLSIVGESVVIEDLHSANGVYVNGIRVPGTRVLAEGERVLLGTTELSLFEIRDSSVLRTALAAPPSLAGLRPPAIGPLTFPPESRPRPARVPRTEEGRASLRLRPAPVSPAAADAPAGSPPIKAEGVPTTARASALSMIGVLAERLAEGGDVAEAIHVLAGQLRRILQGANAGLQVPADMAELAAHYALRITRWSAQAEWVDYVVELHLSSGLLMSLVTLESFETALSRVANYDTLLLGYYLESLRKGAHQFTAEQLGRVQRLGALLTHA